MPEQALAWAALDWNMQQEHQMNAFTDYPFAALGDVAGQEAPIRAVGILAYDGDKMAMVEIDGQRLQVKAGYLYQAAGRSGQVPPLTQRQLRMLPRA